MMLEFCSEPRSRDEVLAALNLTDREHLRKVYLRPATEAGWLAMTVPDKPRSSKQRYVITGKGREVLGAGAVLGDFGQYVPKWK